MQAFSHVFQNSILSFLTNVTAKAANAVAFIIIANLAGSHNAGIFSLGTTYLAIFTAILAPLDELLIRQLARDQESMQIHFNASLTLRLLLTGICYILLFVLVIFVFPYATTTSLPIAILGLALIPDQISFTFQTLFIANERFKTPLLATVLATIIKLGIGTIILQYGGGLKAVSYCWIVGSILGALVPVISAVNSYPNLRLRLSIHKDLLQKTLRPAISFIAIGFLFAMEYQSDVVILSIFQNEDEVGLYSAAVTIIFALTIPAQSFRAAIYPLMVRYKKELSEKLFYVYQHSFLYLGMLALPIVFGLIVTGQAIIDLIFTTTFQAATIPLQIMSLMLVFHYLTIPNSRILLVYNRQNQILRSSAISMMINICANLLLAPRLGASGAAIARVLSASSFFFLVFIYTLHNIIPENPLPQLLKPFIASFIMAMLLWIIEPVNIWITILMGLVIYGAIMFLIRGVTNEERLWLKSLFRGAQQ